VGDSARAAINESRYSVAFGKEQVMKTLMRLIKDEQGTETLEWGLVCGLIVIGGIIAIASIGPKVTAMWNNVDAAIK
jgi:Flp pilus assembly pilin Flp